MYRKKGMCLLLTLLLCFGLFMSDTTLSKEGEDVKKGRLNEQIASNHTDIIESNIVSCPLLQNYIEKYDYYESNDFGNSFIVADALNEEAFSENIIEVKLVDNQKQYYDYGDSVSLREENYVVEFLTYENDILLKSFYIPDINEVNTILEKVKKIERKDPIFKRVVTSMSYETTYKQSFDNIETCNSVNVAGMTDNQAPLDHFLKTKNQADSILPSNTNSNIPSSDNCIVNLLGRNIFTSTGTYQKSGAEWGYYAKTTVDKGSDLLTSILIYDIKTIKEDDRDPDIVSISPVLSMDYKFNYESNVVYQYTANNYCLGNPSYKAGIKYVVLPNNNSEFVPLNPGEQNYNEDDDLGYCIGSKAVKIIGQTKSFASKADYMSNILVLLGNVVLGAATSGLSIPAQAIIGGSYTLLTDAILKTKEEKVKKPYKFNYSNKNGKVVYDSTDINGATSLSGAKEAKQFAKYLEFTMQNENKEFMDSNNNTERKNPILFKDSTDSINYTFNLISSDKDDRYLAQISHLFSAEIFNDNTWLFNQNPTYIGTTSAEWSYIFGKDFDSKEIKVEGGHKDTIIAFGKSKEKIATFTPKKTGVYDILLHDMPSDTTFTINSLSKSTSDKSITDAWGESRRVSSQGYLKYYISLNAGTTYQIGFSRTVNGYRKFGTARLTIYESDCSSVSSGDSKNDSNFVYRDIVNENGVYIDNQFIPKQDGQYTIVVTPSANSNTKDTYMLLLDDEYNVIAADDDGWGDRIAGVRINLVANKAYYIASGFYGTGSKGSYRVSIFKQMYVPELRGNNLKNEFVLQDFGSNYSSQFLLASQSSNHTVTISAFWISNDASGPIDVIIYNDRFEQIVYGTDVNKNPLKFSFSANRLYAIKISTKASLYQGISLKFQEA